jgi:hypothetical protein
MEMSTGGYSWICTYTAAAIWSRRLHPQGPIPSTTCSWKHTRVRRSCRTWTRTRTRTWLLTHQKKCDHLIQSVEYRPEKNGFKWRPRMAPGVYQSSRLRLWHVNVSRQRTASPFNASRNSAFRCRALAYVLQTTTSRAFFNQSVPASGLGSLPTTCTSRPGSPGPFTTSRLASKDESTGQGGEVQGPKDTPETTARGGGPSPCELRNLPRGILGHIGLDKASNEGKEAGGPYARAREAGDL